MIEFHSPLPIDYEATRSRIKAAAAHAAGTIRSIPDPDAPTRGLDWTLGETSAHLCTTMRLYIDCLEGRIVPEPQLVADVPSFVQQQNQARLEAFAERRPAALAERLLTEVDGLLGILEQRAAEDLVAFPAGYHIDIGVQASVALAELLIHGRDIGRSIGERWAIPPDDALLVLSGVIALMPVAADRERAKHLRGTVHTRLRGDGCYAVDISDGSITVMPCSGHADLYVSADPVAAFLSGYGRISPFIPAVTGKILAWGRRPRLAFAMASMFRTG